MSSPQQRLRDRLRHILQAIERIDRYTATMDQSTFLDDSLVQDAVIRNLEIIGEAANDILKRHSEFAAARPHLPLTQAYQMRNALAHGYFSVDFRLVWQTVVSDLPSLNVQVQQALDDLLIGND